MTSLKLREWKRKWRQANKQKAFAYYGNKCNHCGFLDTRALQFDHVNNDGYKEINGHGGHIVARLLLLGKESWAKYQLLCANCNWIKKAQFEASQRGKD